MAVLPSTRIYEGTRIPSPVPTILEIDPDKHDLADILTINFGPNHPSTHGVLRLIVDLDGETVAGIRAVIGYLHTGFEKNMESKTWWKSVTYAPRIDYVSFQSNELVYVLAIEKLLGIEVPRRATWARMALTELNRIHSHLIWLGTSALELGAISLLWYTFDDRDEILDLFEMAGGTRMHTRYFQVGGLAEDLPPGFTAETRKFLPRMLRSLDEYESLLDRNAIWLERTKGIGLLSADDALALAQSGPMLRSSGVNWDLRKTMPYLAYDEVEFDVPVYPNGDVYDRYKVHLDEMRESVRIVRQCLDRIDEMDGRAVDRRRPQGRPPAPARAAHVHGVPDPPLQDRHRGLRRARGRGLRRDRVAARRVRVLPRLRRRGPALAGEVPRAELRRLAGDRHDRAGVPGRRPRRHRRLARPRHGRCGSMTTATYEKIQELRRKYPQSRSAVMDALRLAQEEHDGWLPPEALREVADALDVTPAFCHSIASFYDMYHLEPVGKHMVEVCTNLSCALAGAQTVLDAFASELGVRPGETTDDGEVTLRAIECAGGCGRAPVVVVDHVYHEPLRPEDVPGLLEELRGRE